MLYALVAGTAVALAGGAAAWRRATLARHPEKWPAGLSFEAQVRLVKAFLKRDGWEIHEAAPILNMFVRARRGNLWLALMVHGEETLSLPTLLRDCISKTAGKGLVMGILSRDRLAADLLDDAARNGIYVINPTGLKNVSGVIEKAAIRQREIQRAGRDEPVAEQPPARVHAA